MIEKREENEVIESTGDSGETEQKKDKTPRTIMKVGNKTYLVGIHFNPDSEETMKDKVIRMIKEDVQDDNY
jgi:hypothetical protein